VSGVLGVFPIDGNPLSPLPVERMLAGLQGRGTRSAAHSDTRALLGLVRYEWEGAYGAEPCPAVTCDHDICVVADATLYYRDDLLRSLAAKGFPSPATANTSDLIAAAYRAWGTCFPEHLEGDFAVIVHDRGARRVVCARDFSGRKPLFFAELADVLVIASTVGALLAHPSCPADLDPASIGAAAAGLFAARTETAYRAVRSLPPGHTLVHDGTALRLEPHWQPPPIESRPTVRGRDLDEGAAQLRSLLTRAVAERTDPGRPTAVWMSGGWDSTTVFGAGMAGVPGTGGEPPLRPISISYPPGDPGREDEYIRSVAGFWGVGVHWLDIADIPFFHQPLQRAARRDEPFAHVYEMWNRALARGSRDVGARVALDGVGGDQLFQLSFVYLSDLLRRLRLQSLAREWRAMGLRGRRSFFQWVVLPLLPLFVRRLLALRYGTGLVGSYLDRAVPSWIRPEYVARHELLARERRNSPVRGRMPAVAFETHWYLSHPYAGRILSTVASLALEEGVELRSPLYDRRIIEFAAARPWTERVWRGETKRLLRRAAHDWLPASVLAPRSRRTGLTSGYFAESFRFRHVELVSRILAKPVLADAGIVDATSLSRAWETYRRYGDENLGIALYFTLQTELWLRSRTDPQWQPPLEGRR
jgi:asparagine synthase (glutamine-hydrolysing)